MIILFSVFTEGGSSASSRPAQRSCGRGTPAVMVIVVVVVVVIIIIVIVIVIVTIIVIVILIVIACRGKRLDTRNRHLRNHHGLSVAFSNGCSVALSNELSLVSGICQRFFTFQVDFVSGIVQWIFTLATSGV